MSVVIKSDNYGSTVARIQVVLFAEGNVSEVVRWMEALPPKARAKCIVRLDRLEEMGHELRRPEAEYLRDGIYELRTNTRV